MFADLFIKSERSLTQVSMVKVLDVFFDEKPRKEQSKRRIKKQHFGGGGGGDSMQF
jgi:hypothetical protein